MVKAALVGAFALATITMVSVSENGIGVTPAAAQDVVVTDASIARLKNVLRLSPAQEVHWRALEATLRSLAHEAHSEENNGLVQRVRARIHSLVLDAEAAQRVAMAARPLISSLDEDQKREGLAAVRAMGVASLF